MLCPNCGSEIQENKKFCKNCGCKIPTKYDLILNKLKLNWKKTVIISLFTVLVLTVITLTLPDLINKIQFNNALNKKDFNGRIILVESSEHKPLKHFALGIQAKLNDKYGNGVYLKEYYKDKAVIYISDNISSDAILSYLNKPHLVFKRQKNNSNQWIDSGIDDKSIKNSEISTSPDGHWAVDIEFTENGTVKFAKLTKEIIGQPLAIFFNGELQSTPIIREPITGGRAQISGGENGFTYEEAKNMSLIILSGIDLKFVEEK